MIAGRRLAGWALVSGLAWLIGACGGGGSAPAALQSGETCAYCRMVVSDARLAAQLVGPGEDPLFFDDIGCLAGRLRQSRPSAATVAYVADHRTGEWVEARAAVYTRVDTLATPMGSHLVAHRDEASRGQDPVAQRGVAVAVEEIFAGTLPGGSTDER